MPASTAQRSTGSRIKCPITIIISLTFAAGVLASEPMAPAPGTPAAGTPAPSFSGELLGGGTLALESLRGKVVLLNFWAVECPPCRIEMPELEKIHRRYSKQGLRVLGVTEMDPTRDQVIRSVKELGVTYPILLDPGGRIATLYGIEAHPTSFVIDAKGMVRFVNGGYLKGEEKDIEREIRNALAAPRKEVGGKP